ncbi:SAM-dependent methyltransferase [Nonomuraea sp. NPDC049269]|uniref:SAM-dependent methyltransferase n=1 Tax=Nonomuraea sp. NPDC049269 TaxID=3364349 RepID=UPI00371CF5B7
MGICWRGFVGFLDICTELLTVDNTHELAQQADPTSRGVYVDNDPLCAGSRQGAPGV